MSDDGRRSGRDVQVVIGIAILVVGLWLLAETFLLPLVPQLTFALSIARRAVWPTLLIVAGAAIVVYASRPGVRMPERGARLYRSRHKQLLAGVLGGLSDYFGIDVTVLRLAYVLLLLLNFWPSLVAYIILAIVIPLEPVVAQAPPSPPAQ